MVPDKPSSAIKPRKKEQTDSAKEPQTMEDLLAQEDITLSSLSRGDAVSAKILKIGRREILADIGAKSYGIIVGREFEHIASMRKNLSIGDVYDAEVVIPEMEGGETLISLRKTLVERIWEELTQAAHDKKEISVMSDRPISGGLLVEYKSLRGFIPQMQLDPAYQDAPERLTGKTITVQVLEVDQRQNRLVMSQKEVTRKEELAQKRTALKQFAVNNIVKSEITAVDRYTISVRVAALKGSKKKVPPVEGTIHISEVSWERVDNLEELFTSGNSLEAMVIALDEQEGQLVLSLKQLMPDPWTGIEKKYPKDKQLGGKIVKVSGIGAFVELEKGIEGLIHVSKIPAEKEFKEGEKVQVMIDSLDVEKRKISLAYVPTTKPIGYR